MAYTQVHKISGSSSGFGSVVAIEGYYALVSDSTSSSHLYERQPSGKWALSSSFTATSASVSFGSSFSISGDYFIVGDAGYDLGKGRVTVHSLSSPSTVVQTLFPSGLTNGDAFGVSVDMSDSYILVGANTSDDNYKGEVYLYIKGSGATWSEYSGNPIRPAFRNNNDYFGSAVAINGTSLIIGAKGDNNKTGAVYIFEYDSEDEVWEESQKLFASGGAYNDEFGASLSASNNYFVAGARLAESSTNDVNAGASYLYKYSGTWYEVDKITGTGESSYAGNNFGASVSISGDNLVVGSTGARDTGVADTFNKKRSWGHQTKILGSDSASDDDFGESVGISGRFLVVGASGNGSNGAVYFYEDPQIRMRLAQEFVVNGQYLPSKATVYLKRRGSNVNDYWSVGSSAPTIIDATNFSEMWRGNNVVMLGDEIEGFTGNGYMISRNDATTRYTRLNYPVRTTSADTFNLWIRCLSTTSNTFQADILIDDNHSKTISETVADPSDLSWTWIQTTLVLPDISQHILGIRIKENGNAIDKIYIDADDTTPYSEGPDYGESPYFTVHMQVYDRSGDEPDSALFIYDYKSSVGQIKLSDWYNFDIGVRDQSHGYTSASDFSGSYFLVMSASGITTDNFVIWEMVDNDEYLSMPSAFRF